MPLKQAEAFDANLRAAQRAGERLKMNAPPGLDREYRQLWIVLAEMQCSIRPDRGRYSVEVVRRRERVTDILVCSALRN